MHKDEHTGDEKDKHKDHKNVFYFSRNKKVAKIFTKEDDVYDGFAKHLARLCILSSFMENYQVVKLIGQGSYGKVLFLISRYIKAKLGISSKEKI